MSDTPITNTDLDNFKKEILNHQKLLLEDLKKHLDNLVQDQKIKANRGILKNSEVKEMLGFSSGTLQNLRNNGSLPYSKIGGTILYDFNDIMFLIEKNKKNIKNASISH